MEFHSYNEGLGKTDDWFQDVVVEVPKYTKVVNKKGDGTTFPRKGDTVSCFYTGTLTDGTVFDTNLAKKKPVPLKFKGIIIIIVFLGLQMKKMPNLC